MKVAPSILSANWLNLAKTVNMLEDAGADWLHIDVMDGHFVPDITMGSQMVSNLAQATLLPLDVHLMVDNPEHFIEPLAIAGAKHIYIHCELTNKDIKSLLQYIHSFGCKAGLAINPESPVAATTPFLDHFENILVMSVNPGKSGQKFMPEALNKISFFCDKVEEIVVDGGINNYTSTLAADAGASALVSGSYIFNHSNPATAIQQLKSL